MISFRYHLVTIVGVFLALALGLLAGSSFGQPALVNQLRDRTEDQLVRIDELRAEVDDSRARAASLEAFAASAIPYLIRDELVGYRAVVVTQEGVPSEVEESVLGALTSAGADVLLTVSAQPLLSDEDPETMAALASILGVPAQGDLAEATGAALATRLGAAIAPLEPEGDILRELLTAGFLAARDGAVDEDVRTRIHAGQLIVVVLGGSASGSEPMATPTFARAVALGLGDLDVPVAACEPSNMEDGWIADLPVDRVVTVAGIDEVSGPASLVLGLRARLDSSEGVSLGGDAEPLPPLP